MHIFLLYALYFIAGIIGRRQVLISHAVVYNYTCKPHINARMFACYLGEHLLLIHLFVVVYNHTIYILQLLSEMLLKFTPR